MSGGIKIKRRMRLGERETTEEEKLLPVIIKQTPQDFST